MFNGQYKKNFEYIQKISKIFFETGQRFHVNADLLAPELRPSERGFSSARAHLKAPCSQEDFGGIEAFHFCLTFSRSKSQVLIQG